MGNQAFLEAVFRAAIAAVDPERAVRRHLVRRDGGDPAIVAGARTVARLGRSVFVVAAGKAAAGMMRAASGVLGEVLSGGIVSAPVVVRRLPRRIETFAGEHPLPGAGSLAAGRAAWRLAGELGEGDTLLVLLSGGASSLLALPAPGIRLADKVAVTQALLRSGASIAEVNAVRKHLSRLKGGGLARRAGEARVVTLLLSDVIGSPPAVIGSGPTAADPTTFADARRILQRHDLLDRVPEAVRRRIEEGCRGAIQDTPGAGTLRARHVLVADVRRALAAAADEASRRGAAVRVVTASLRGDTRRAARRLAREALRARPGVRPVCLLAGGETTVVVRGDGRGGRNQEMALEMARLVEGRAVSLLSAGTDGVDGPTDAAGAFADGTTIARARRLGLDASGALARNDSGTFFERLGDLFRPGPTGTNVMDLKIVLVGRRPRGRA